MMAWLTALRIARREARRAKGRSTLVIVMIGLPVLCLAFAAVSYDMFNLTPAEKADRVMGAAEVRVRWDYRGPVEQTVDGQSWPASAVAEPTAKPGEEGQGGGAVTEAEMLAKMPAGSEALAVERGTVKLRTPAGAGDIEAVVVDATHRLTRGYIEVQQGRAPRDASEVALSAQGVSRLGQGLGASVTTADGSHSFTVVGIVEFPSLLQPVALFAPSALATVQRYGEFGQVWFVDTHTPITWAQVRELNQFGLAVTSRAVFADPPPADQVPIAYRLGLGARELAVGVLVAGLGLLEVILLAGPAFAVGARRRQRQLALVAANGGTPAHVRRIVLADGVVLGFLGAAAGIALGIVAAFLARPYLEEHLAYSRAGAYRVYPLALAAIMGLAVLTGVLAALVPAFVTARQDVVTALAGRRGITRSRKRWLLLGLGMAGAAVGIVVYGALRVNANVMLAGLALGEIGLVLCTPSLVGLIARMGRSLPLAPRIALRDAARNRASAAPAISAVMAAVAGSVAIGLYFASQEALLADLPMSLPAGTVIVDASTGDPTQPSRDIAPIETAVRAVLPVTSTYRLTTVTCPPGSTGNRSCALVPILPPERICPFAEAVFSGAVLTANEMRTARRDPRCDDPYSAYNMGQVYVDDGNGLDLITDASQGDMASAAAVLRSGGVVVHDARFVKDGQVTLAVVDGESTQTQGPVEWLAAAKRMSFPAYVLGTGNVGMPPIVSPALVARTGLATAPYTMIVETTRPPTQEELDRLTKQLEPLGGYISVIQQPRGDAEVVLLILAIAAGLITLGAAGIATGLAAADGRGDLSTLAAVGATPRLRRGLSLSQSGVIAGLGSLLGAIAGLGAAVAILAALNQRYADIWPGPPTFPILVPWTSLAVSLLVVPVVAMLGAGLLTRSRLPIERRI
jgi:putative ABC transport system permease protein